MPENRIKEIGPKIDIGCGGNKQVGFIGIDFIDYGQEIVWDIRNGLPFPDQSIEEIYSAQFFEHLTPPEVNKLAWEIKRVAKPGCKMLMVVPVDWPDIAHYSYWNDKIVRGFCSSWGVNLEKIEIRDNNIWAWIII
jgi:predicted SAM-dependent methyltransferase